MSSHRDLLNRLLAHHDLSVEEASAWLAALLDPEVDAVVKAGLLVAMRAKGETAKELHGMARAMRAAAVPVAFGDVSDTAGTGGDGKHTVNLSTAAALVVAAAGYPVAKHGNRSVSSRSGSADVLEALGIEIPDSAVAAEHQLGACGFTFLFAPRVHPAMAAVVPVRNALSVRTAFNLLGPLTNPAAPRVQLVGAYSEDAAERMAHALHGLAGDGALERAAVVHDHAGHDEATPLGPFVRFDVDVHGVRRTVVDPLERYGVPRCAASALDGGSASDNAAILRRVFAGEPGGVRDAVVLNAGLVLELRGVPDPMVRAAQALCSGAVSRLVARLQAPLRVAEVTHG